MDMHWVIESVSIMAEAYRFRAWLSFMSDVILVPLFVLALVIVVLLIARSMKRDF